MTPSTEAFTPPALLGVDAMGWTLAILVVCYAVIISERVNRAVVALLGGCLLLLTGLLSQAEAIAHIDFNTLTLLVGMMVLVAVTGRSGVFQYVAIWVTKLVRGHPPGILLMIAVVTALFSALLDNVTTVLLITPVTLLIAEELQVPALPFLFSIILSANIGGTATLVGDPPNILIGSATDLHFVDFIVNLAPVVIVIQVIVLGVLYLLWGRQLKTDDATRRRVMGFKEREAIRDGRLLKQAGVVMTLVLGGFLFGHTLGWEPGIIALAGAALLLLLHYRGQSAEAQSEGVNHAFQEVEWVTIFFFIGLFVIVGGVEASGLLDVLAEQLLTATAGDLATTATVVLWVAALLSAVLDNIPFVATMIPLLEATAPRFGGPEVIEPLWWSLSLGACLGGNGTLVGASANLTVAALAAQAHQPIGFKTFAKVAFPIMLGTVVLANGYLLLRYF